MNLCDQENLDIVNRLSIVRGIAYGWSMGITCL